MAATRLIGRLDIKGPNLIKGVHLEGLRVIGDPQEFAKRYYDEGIDELLYLDIVASLYGRSKLLEIVQRTARDVFVPLTVGGGIREINDVRELLRAGADKVAINTMAVRRPELISDVARRFGSQCMVLSIEAKAVAGNRWEVYTDCGRERTGVDVIEWARRAVMQGAGEIIVTSIDREGTRQGFEADLIRAVVAEVEVPVVASGGFGALNHLTALSDTGISGFAIADAFHYERWTISEVREAARSAGFEMRHP